MAKKWLLKSLSADKAPLLDIDPQGQGTTSFVTLYILYWKYLAEFYYCWTSSCDHLS